MSDERTTEQLAEIEGQAELVQVREGRWRTRSGEVKNIRPCEPLKGAYYVWPWTDGFMTFQDNGLHQGSKESDHDLVKYLGPIEPDKTQELETKTQELETKTQELPEYTPPEGWRVLAVGEILQAGDMWVWPTDDQLRQTVHVGAVVGAKQRYIRPIEPQPEPVPQPQAATIEELRSEVSYVQRLLGESNRKVTQLEDLVGSLRTINEAQEKAFEAAGQHNSDLQSRLNAVCSEWVQQAETIRRLQIELDAAQQVPADSPELRQLRADLEQMTQDRDTYRHAHELLMNDVNATHQRTKAMTVEAIAEWLEPIRLVDSPNLANETLQHLPQIMRSLVGLDSPEDVD